MSYTGIKIQAREGVFLPGQAEHQRILEVACRAFDRAEAARLAIAKDGMVVGNKRHPLIGVEAKAQEVYLRAIRELDLGDTETPALDVSAAARHAAMKRWHDDAA